MSSSPSDLSKLPKWPFLLADAALVATAFAIAWHRTGPLSGVPLVSVVICIVIAAILCAIPFLVDYARSEREELDERQRGLEALARTTGATAEQVSIAAQALGGMADQSKSLLTLIERAAAKLDERVSDLQQQLAAGKDEEVETLERELSALRDTEAGRLESAAEKIHKAATDLARAEASAAKHAAAAHEALDKLAAVGPNAAQQITRQAETASTSVSRAIAQAQAEASAALEAEQRRLSQTFRESTEGGVAALERRIEALAIVLQENVGTLAQVAERLCAAVASAEGVKSEAAAEHRASRKAKSSRPASAPSPDPAPGEAPAASPEGPANPASVEPVETVVADPAPVVAADPIAPPVDDPVEQDPAPARDPAPVEEDAAELTLEPTPSDDGVDQSTLEESAPAYSVSADGATRLIVTAYIGIGNRLYVRGEGPGLTWDKGLPLQFVSIGKWRWESADAASPVKIKLLKNDQTECGSLGEIVIEPGQQAEVTAAF